MEKKKLTFWKFIKRTVRILVLITMVIAIFQTNEALNINKEQSEKTTLPVIVFDVMSNGDFSAVPIIRNVGVGPAFNIKVLDYTHKDFKAEFITVTGLEKDGQIQLKYQIYDNKDISNIRPILSDSIKNDFYKFISQTRQSRGVRATAAKFDSCLVITYCDIIGNEYQIEESLDFNINKNEFKYLITKFPQKVK